MEILIFGREPRMVSEAVTALQENGFRASGTTRDDTALELLDTGRFDVIHVGGGIEYASRGPVMQRAQQHGALILESNRAPWQTVGNHVRTMLIPQLRAMEGVTKP